MKKVDIPWQAGVLLVCQKCGKSFKDPIDSELIRTNLKKKFKESGISPAIRVVSSSCLDICIPSEQAITFCPNTGESLAVTFSGNDIEGQIESFARSLVKI